MTNFRKVDVKERLPEKSGRYFVYIKNDFGDEPIMNSMDFNRFEDGCYGWTFGLGVCNQIKVLYWLEPIDLSEVDELKQWINDLQSGMYINCVYCGHRYGPSKDTPAIMADVLKEHIEQCPKHPISELKRKLKEAQDDRDWLLKDANRPWKVNLLAPTASDPFRKLECKIVDIGYADKILLVECEDD